MITQLELSFHSAIKDYTIDFKRLQEQGNKTFKRVKVH